MNYRHDIVCIIIFAEIVYVCFMHIIQADLKLVRWEWNSHRIRLLRNSDSPSGHPNELYYMPEILGEYN